jgi:hypothetical protein
MAKAKRPSPAEIFDEAVASSGAKGNWLDMLPKEDRDWLEQLMRIYAERPRKPSIKMLHEKATAAIGLPVKKHAFAEFVNRWMTTHGTKTAG